MTDHEYSILDHDRGQIFQYIGTGITVLATAYTASYGVVSHLIKHVYPSADGILPKTLDAGIAFTLLYFIFNRWFWRNWVCRKVFNYHDISGSWKVEAKTLGPAESLDADKAPRPWTGTIKINQQWTKIGVRLNTSQSESFSRSAAVQDVDGEALLMYSYSNQPTASARVSEGLQGHHGYCELRFKPDRKSAEGWYFNNMGRVTFGEMKLTKL